MIRVLASVLLILAAQVSQAQVYIRVNQVGFTPTDVKTAIVFGNEALPSDFRIVDAASGKVVFTGRIAPVTGAWGQFQRHGELKFSSFTTDGRFVVEAGGGRSLPFNIKRSAYADFPDQLLEFMRQQRCGYNPFVDAVCHSFDGRTAFGPEPAGTYLNASGGWHDAGRPTQVFIDFK
jgi:hypothetical protein